MSAFRDPDRADAIDWARRTICDDCGGEADIIICRAVPGEHVGGPDCWCVPHRIYANDIRSTEDLILAVEAAERPN